jgi:hypothetical protein
LESVCPLLLHKFSLLCTEGSPCYTHHLVLFSTNLSLFRTISSMHMPCSVPLLIQNCQSPFQRWVW